MPNYHILAILSALLLAACDSPTNQPVVIEDGAQVTDSRSTVNGSVQVGRDAVVGGSLSTVNGRIEIGENSQVARVSTVNGRIELGAGSSARAAETVNGGISLGAGSQVEDGVSTVNGSVRLDSGAVVGGAVSAVNGSIALDGAEAGNLSNHNGNITVDNGSVVHGHVTVHPAQEQRRFLWMRRDFDVTRIVIGRDSRVAGPLVFKREVELFVHETAEVGEIEGAEAVIFSGDEP